MKYVACICHKVEILSHHLKGTYCQRSMQIVIYTLWKIKYQKKWFGTIYIKNISTQTFKLEYFMELKLKANITI